MRKFIKMAKLLECTHPCLSAVSKAVFDLLPICVVYARRQITCQGQLRQQFEVPSFDLMDREARLARNSVLRLEEELATNLDRCRTAARLNSGLLAEAVGATESVHPASDAPCRTDGAIVRDFRSGNNLPLPDTRARSQIRHFVSLSCINCGRLAFRFKAKPLTGSPDRVDNVARRQMPVVFLNHTCVRVAKVASHHEQGNASHDGKRGPGVSQDMKRHHRPNLGALAGFAHRTGL